MIIRIPLFFTIFSALAAAQDFQKTCHDIKWESKDKHDPSISASCGGPNGDKHNVLRLNDCYAYNGGGKFDIVEGGNAFKTCALTVAEEMSPMGFAADCNGRKVPGDLFGLVNTDGNLKCVTRK